jgi:hypothetical protein
MKATLHSTRDHYIQSRDSLGWELTVCNSLYPEKSPCRRILKQPASYGNLLYDFLSRFLPMGDIRGILEIGGGYGYLMKDFLARNSSAKVTMLDISPFLLERQKETLSGFDVQFMAGDFLEADPLLLEGKDLVILNEILGDFPVALGVSGEALEDSRSGPDQLAGKVKHFCDRYGLELPGAGSFSVNIGALEALEKICSSEIPYIFLSEHSCEARVPPPYEGLIRISSSGGPERIRLKGHDEYTIRFSHLEAVARSWGYISTRGPVADYVQMDFSPRLRSILAVRSGLSDEDEIIRHFLEDLYKYEYLLLTPRP